jgi:anthranilate phosphoribosyltransferase
MNLPQAIQAVIDGRSLAHEEMREIWLRIMTGEATPAQIGALLVGLRMKGETVEEIAAAAEVMRSLATRVAVDVPNLVDTCGTGGDAQHTFNISTASAFVAAAAGAHVAKHGNRSVSSKSGSADVLEAAGAKIDLAPEQVARCVRETGVGFMFAPVHHGAMKHAIGPRREMGVRTVFNLLGPLTNPAGAQRQVVGVFGALWLEPVAQVLDRLGSRHVLVVHSEDGLDEISIGAPTEIAELRAGRVRRWTVAPEQFGLARAGLAALTVGTAQDSLRLIREVFAGQPGPARDIVALNAGAAVYVSGLADSLEEGVRQAQRAIDTGGARAKLDRFVAATLAA